MVVNIKMSLEIGYEDIGWINVAQDREEWWAFFTKCFLLVPFNLFVPKDCGPN
jgi:hypothetical protein